MYVQVFNNIGDAESPIVTAILATVPDAPPIPSLVTASSDDTKITIDLSAFPSSSNGGSDVTSFEIQMAIGQVGPYVSLVGVDSPFTALTYTQTSGITKGETYRFIYRAKNVNGFGSFSPELEVLAATKPQAPSKPELVSVDSTKIDLKFKATEDNGGDLVTDYQLFIDGGSEGSTFNELTNYTYSTHGFSYSVIVSDESLSVGKFYRFKYLAVNSKGPSEKSNALTVPLADVPATPSSLSLTALTQTSVQAEWIASVTTGTTAGDILGYKIYRDDGLSGSFSLIFDGSNIATVRSITTSSLVSGYYYKFKHVAVNSAGSSSYSPEVGVYTCVEPSGIAAPTLGTITQTSVEVFWTAPSSNGGCPIEGYELYVTNLARSAYNEVHSGSVNDLPNLRTFTITELPSGVLGNKMNIQVKAKNSAGLYGESDILEVTVAGVPSKPTAAPTEDEDVTTKSTIGVAYTEPDNQGSTILSYEVQIDDGDEGEFTTFAGGDTSNYITLKAQTSSGIVEALTYRVRYRAKNVNGWGEYSDIVYILAASVPDPPSKPLYSSSTNTTITVGLSPSVVNNGAPITSHILYMDSGSLTSTFTDIFTNTGSDLTYEATGLTLGLTYRFYYVAKNIKGNSEPSGEARYTAGEPPSAPTSLQASSTTTSSITLTWSSSSSSIAITGYTVDINDGTSSPSGRVLSSSAITGAWVEVYDGRGQPGVNSVTISELETGKLYRFRAVSYDSNGPSEYSPVAEFYSCTDPSKPGAPVVQENTLSTMLVTWTAPSDNGGCGITEYELYRNDGQGSAITTQIHSNELSGHPEITEILVAELPTDPKGLTFKFKVLAKTSFNTDGVASDDSEEYLLALAPDAPTIKPSEGSNTNADQVEISISIVSETNGADIISYHVQIDDGDGGDFVTVSGLTSNVLDVTRLVTSGIVTGRLYRSRYRARNIIGFSEYSPIGYIEASQEPDQPNAPTVTISGSDVIISWTLPDNKGNSITDIELYIQNKAGVLTSHGNLGSVTTTTLLMTEFTSTYLLIQGDDILTAIKAYNENGWSQISSTSATGILVEVVPHKPTVLPQSSYSPLTTSDADYGTRMIITVSELTGEATGGSAITSYQVEYYNTGSGSWVILGGNSPESLDTSYTVTGLTNGESYQVRYRAKNAHGFGEYSDSASIIAAEVPQKITSAPTLAYSNELVVVVWTKPLDGGSTITGYFAEFVTSSGDYITLTDCNVTGEDTLTCSPSMNDIVASTSLSEGSSIQVRVTATNAQGSSDPSDLNSIAVKVKPHTPTTLPTRNSATDQSSLVVDFGPVDPANNGGSDITSYILEMLVSSTWTEVIGISSNNPSTLQATVTSPDFTITSGETYSFRWSAKNIYGTSDPSPIGEIKAISSPAAPSEVTLSVLANGKLHISWSLPSDTGGTGVLITDHVVTIKQKDGAYSESVSLCDGSSEPALTGLY